MRNVSQRTAIGFWGAAQALLYSGKDDSTEVLHRQLEDKLQALVNRMDQIVVKVTHDSQTPASASKSSLWVSKLHWR